MRTGRTKALVWGKVEERPVPAGCPPSSGRRGIYPRSSQGGYGAAEIISAWSLPHFERQHTAEAFQFERNDEGSYRK